MANSSSDQHKTQKFDFWSEAKRAEHYAKHRPRYEKTVIPWLLEYYRRTHSAVIDSRIPLAIDVACGSGQLSGQLAEACERVIGIDISSAMLETAKQHNNHPNVDYRLGSAQKLTEACPGEKADIITVGMAINFFDNNDFYSKVKEMLSPGGVLGVFGYMTCGFEIEGLESLLIEFLEDQVTDQTVLNVTHSLMNSYKDIHLPFESLERRTSRLLLPVNQEGIIGMFMSNPQIFKDGEKGILAMAEKLPAHQSFGLICEVCGVMAHV